jgi:methyl-accepting chemotaxis protein
MTLTIAKKIYAILGGILGIFLVMFGLLLAASHEQTSEYAERYHRDVEAAVQLSTAQDALWRLRYGFPQFLAYPEGSAERQKIVDDEPGLHAAVAEALGRFEKTGIDAAQGKVLSQLREAYRQYTEARPRWFQLIREGKLQDAADWRARTTTPFGAATVKGFGDLLSLSQKASASHIEELTAATSHARTLVVIMFAVGAMLALLAAVWLVRMLVPRLHEARRAAERVAQGDLSARIRNSSRDEAGQLLDAIASMNEGLSKVVSQVRVCADAVVTASAQVAAGTTDLSQRTEEQASSLEETSASMEELAGTVNQNAENARQADELARSVSKRAEQGGAEVGRAVATMSEVSQSAARIADIIGVIDAISFQTNILALNAAVEAARAGEQGRGFAVVAAEVRSLAQRSAQAAKEIKDLIKASVAKAEDGTRQVEQAGATIHTLVTDVKHVSDFMAAIAQASGEQSRGVQQVNKTVTEMDRAVQQNATAVQQAAAAAESMRSHAQSLFDAVAIFHLTAEDRMRGTETPDEASEAAEPARVVPLRRAAPSRPAATRASPAPAGKRLAAVGGDDWEEF